MMAMNVALKQAILASGLKQKHVARRAGMDEWRLSRIVHQDICPRRDERRALARVLRRPPRDLFEAST